MIPIASETNISKSVSPGPKDLIQKKQENDPSADPSRICHRICPRVLTGDTNKGPDKYKAISWVSSAQDDSDPYDRCDPQHNHGPGDIREAPSTPPDKIEQGCSVGHSRNGYPSQVNAEWKLYKRIRNPNPLYARLPKPFIDEDEQHQECEHGEYRPGKLLVMPEEEPDDICEAAGHE